MTKQQYNFIKDFRLTISLLKRKKVVRKKRLRFTIFVKITQKFKHFFDHQYNETLYIGYIYLINKSLDFFVNALRIPETSLCLPTKSREKLTSWGHVTSNDVISEIWGRKKCWRLQILAECGFVLSLLLNGNPIRFKWGVNQSLTMSRSRFIGLFYRRHNIFDLWWRHQITDVMMMSRQIFWRHSKIFRVLIIRAKYHLSTICLSMVL